MFKSHELRQDSSPTPVAYDGSWLEMIENPDSSPALPEVSARPESSAFDDGSDFGSSVSGPIW